MIQLLHTGGPLGANLPTRFVILVDIQPAEGQLPIQACPVRILLPSELAEHNNGQRTFWLGAPRAGLKQSIPPAILTWPRGLPRHHPHYSSYLLEVPNAT